MISCKENFQKIKILNLNKKKKQLQKHKNTEICPNL